MGNILDISEVLLEMGLGTSSTDTERAICQEAIRRAESAIKRHLKYDPYYGVHTEYYPQQDFAASASSGGVWEDGSNGTMSYRPTATGASELLQLLHLPLRSTVAMQIYIDYDGRNGAKAGAFAANTLKTEGIDYWANYDSVDSSGNKVCRDGMLRSHGLWPTEPGSVKAVYYGGYTSAELHGQDTVIDASQLLDAALTEAVIRAKRAFVQAKGRRGWQAGALQSESLGDYSYSVGGSDIAKTLSYGSSTLTAETIEKLSEFVHWGFAL